MTANLKVILKRERLKRRLKRIKIRRREAAVSRKTA